ncbi:MAG: polysaccharide biosynthesis/export family protein [Prolixibacteraceae bacterium]
MKQTFLILALFISVLFPGCRSSEDLIYLSDISQEEWMKGLPETETEYLIKPGDILYVSIKSMNPEVNALFNPEEGMQVQSSGFGYQKYTTPQGAYLYGFEVDVNGQLNLPQLGSIPVKGNILAKIEEIVQERANLFLKDATVKVKLLNYKVTVLGEVKSPGVYYNYNNDFTIFEALAMANGNTDYASIKRVMVMRPEAGGKRTYLLNLSSKDVFRSPAFYLHPNDYVFVEPDKNKNFQLNSAAISVVFSSLSMMLAVIGLIIR